MIVEWALFLADNLLGIWTEIIKQENKSSVRKVDTDTKDGVK